MREKNNKSFRNNKHILRNRILKNFFHRWKLLIIIILRWNKNNKITNNHQKKIKIYDSNLFKQIQFQNIRNQLSYKRILTIYKCSESKQNAISKFNWLKIINPNNEIYWKLLIIQNDTKLFKWLQLAKW